MVGNDQQILKMSEPPLKIRKADSADLSDMMRLENMCFSYEAFSIQQLRYLLDTETAISLVAEYDGKFAGFIIGITNRNRFGKYGRIYTIDVDQSFRRLGAGKALIEALLRRMRDANCRRCFLEVRQENTGAIALYEKIGFEKKNVILNYYSEGVHAIKMKIEI